MPWLLNEDAAVKRKFEALSVTDENAPSGARPVTVRFRMPETEMGNVSYPMIYLDHAGISKADDREHRSGVTYLPYVPEGYDQAGVLTRDPETGEMIPWDTTTDFDPTLSPFRTRDYPIPYNIDYTVTVEARYNSHITQIVGALAVIDRIPARFGYIEVPEDGTVRTLDLLGGPEIAAERDGDGKRIFRAVYSIRVVSELSLYDVYQVSNYVDSVDLQVIRVDNQN